MEEREKGIVKEVEPQSCNVIMNFIRITLYKMWLDKAHITHSIPTHIANHQYSNYKCGSWGPLMPQIMSSPQTQSIKKKDPNSMIQIWIHQNYSFFLFMNWHKLALTQNRVNNISNSTVTSSATITFTIVRCMWETH